MNHCFAIALLLAQAPGVPAAGTAQDDFSADTAPQGQVVAQEAAPEPVAERYEGAFADGAAELRRLALAGDTDAALELSDSLLVPGPLASLRARAERRTGGASERLLESMARPLNWLGMPVEEGVNRAEVHYARGLVFALRSELQPSNESFELARVLAGPGATRLDAIYNQGNLDFALGETLRQMIPEIVGEEDVVERPADMKEEPLDVARAMYMAAREHYVERLSADWRDADSRANAELTLRRLRELDQVEREREEQEQQDESEQEDQEKKEGEQEPSDEEQEPEDDPSDEEGSEDQDADQPDESEEEQPEDSEESEEEKEGEESEDESEQESQQAEPKEQEEQHLTAEEVKRLLERLQELDEKGEELRERLRGVRRVPVKRDW
ncbi:MAG: hypothetical protein ACI8QZ_003634 [Chlamydiales bacterium]